MSRPPSLQQTRPEFGRFGTTREREFFKYLPPVTIPLQHVERNTRSVEFSARASLDCPLTAFAQLGTLRLDAQRVIISLFGRHEEYILAEATRTLSLRDETVDRARDKLWLGACTMSYDRSFCTAIANSPSFSQTPAKHVFVVPDLTHDDTFHDHPDVINCPNIRFLACAPIVSPKGIVIGAYTILDDKPRASPTSDILKFLTDMAATVMDYLVAGRCRSQHLRGERMMVGLGSFLEGKGSLRSSWLEDNEVATSHSQFDDAEGRIDAQQQHKQRSEAVAWVTTNKKGQSDMPFCLNSPVPPSQRDDKTRGRRRTSPKSQASTSQATRDQSRFRKPYGVRANVEQGLKSRLKQETLTSQVGATFARAANIVRESLEVEGVVFFDANFGGQDAFVTSGKPEWESSLESSASEGEVKAGKGNTASKLVQSRVQNSGPASVDPARILGFATSNTASVNHEMTEDARINISEAFLAGLLHRYPGGKIFKFGEDGAISSDDTSDGVFATFNTRGDKKYKETRRSILRQDALALLNLAPGSRSILFSPVWDSHKSRWHAGTLAWTKAPQRVFTPDDELTFCTVIGISIMAEIHRLRALSADRAKFDLLAGLSHELRSPLHGIFGTTDLLNDTALDALQQGLVHTIASCTSTLLGSINQLLEFANVNDMQRACGANPPLSHRHSSLKGGDSSQAAEMNAQAIVQLDAAVETAVDITFTGFSFFHESHIPRRGAAGASSDYNKSIGSVGAVKLILDINSAPNWAFAASPDAWHLILTNIVGNALKYTQQGYIYISVTAKPEILSDDKEPLRSRVTMSVQDTGCGMNPEFLRNGYFAAFSQEDDTSPGNGLGASIVQRTVSSLGGEVKITSEKGVGTQVTVSLTLDHASEHFCTDRGLGDNIGNDSLASTRRLVSRKRIGILGPGPSELDSILSSSLRKICEEWLHMEVNLVAPSHAGSPRCHFYISSHEYLDMGNLDIQSIVPDSDTQFAAPIIIICPSPRVAHSLSMAARRRGDSYVIEFIAQPCGPRKLAKTLHICLERQRRRIQAIKNPGPSKSSARDQFVNRLPFTSALESNRQPRSESADYSASTASQPVVESLGKPVPAPGYQDILSLSLSTQVLTPKSEPTHKEKVDPDPSTWQDSPLVLLVDDNHINISLLVAFTRKLGLGYLTAYNGQEALALFNRYYSRIRIVLMDISMPVMDGLESTRQIRAFENTLKQHARVTIVALTGVAQADVQRDAMGSKMDLFLTKPVRLQTIARTIHDHTELKVTLPKDGSITAPL
ncbi:uncharacterized protein BO88DRAFT_406398 [Aspergillus vadensis CBS 113365]|uniref:histidine kinase n=1 Tax=Aspergillus vadensis (strain CBS 113365 / IMI 142717 / IBT 24658) TaxID=1448311 RepID=A0A319B5X2_ASPVC|nr:hypothetical protein BO88DRAFT_406398 [Aspergillus vadensis CBS 113365]PYH67204.1 hypothetical protein BO88DRAFT_406398 [Aspergillus vadensis CBS 113365]